MSDTDDGSRGDGCGIGAGDGASGEGFELGGARWRCDTLACRPGPTSGRCWPVCRGDRCPSPHWGIVLEGSITLEHADGRKERVGAGEVYHWPAGHTAVTEEGVVFLEVGPTVEMRQFSEHAKKVLG